MSKISLDVRALGNIRNRINDLYRRIGSIENSLSSARNSLDWDVRNHNGIDGSFCNVLEDISDREIELMKAEQFLISTIQSYKDAECQLLVKLNMNNEDPKPEEKEAYEQIKDLILLTIKSLTRILNSYFRKILMRSPYFLIIAQLGRILKILIALGIKLNNEQLEENEPDKTHIPILNGVLEYNIDEYNPDVLIMQKRLNELGYTDANGNKLEEDGIFGSRTLEAVNKYKEEYNLWNSGEHEGKVGTTTWEHMFTNPKVPYEPEGDNAGTGEGNGTQEPPSNGTYSDGLVNIDTLITLVDDYSDFTYTDAQGNVCEGLQIHYDWAGKMSLEEINAKMIELGLSADDPNLQQKMIDLANNEGIRLGIDCSGLVLQLINQSTNGMAIEYYKEVIPGLENVSDVMHYGISAANLTSLEYSTKIETLSDVRPGDYIRFDDGAHIGIIYKVEGNTIYYIHSSGGKGPHKGTITVSEEGMTGLDLKNHGTFDDWSPEYSQRIGSLFNYICRPNFLYSNDTISQPENVPPVTANNQESTQMMNNLRNNTSLGLSQEKKDSMIIMGTTLLNEGYEPAFVAGVLSNIQAEGTTGKFESSNYVSNPGDKPDYLVYMDSNYNYRSEFSGKNISEVGIEKTYNVLKELERNGYTGKFGLGSVQWTGSRTMGLINCYIEVCGKDGYPTKEQCLQAESLFIAREFNNDYHYVYEKWESQYKNADNAAYGAGSIVCTDYEVPTDRFNKAVTRGNNSENIYDVMMGS
ncbi:MAG: peptidoglycan-binding protein [Clostridiaceae bacterium]|nr:peptidoglycan-binding protein [Clostridiaceae bacterium]